MKEGSVVAMQPCVKSAVPVCGIGAGEAVDGYHSIAADLWVHNIVPGIVWAKVGVLRRDLCL